MFVTGGHEAEMGTANAHSAGSQLASQSGSETGIIR